MPNSLRLLVDAGNTRIKWALVNQQQWLQQGSCLTAEADSLIEQITKLSQQLAHLPDVWISNVAGAQIQQQLITTFPQQFWQLTFIQAQPQQCGVINLYQNPAQLGCDRWAALIAAWQQSQQGCLVVNCGTATTIDALSDEGTFLGGLILPGLSLMASCLSQQTSLPSIQTEQLSDFPQNTQQALFNGAIQASCGAIVLQLQKLNSANNKIILSGGAAPKLIETLKNQLNTPYQLNIVDNLVLHGLNYISQG